MADYKNLSQNVNLTSFSDILSHANTMTDGTFWTGIYWMIIIIVLLSSLAFGVETAIILAFFLGMILGIFLLYLGLIEVISFGITVAALLFLVIYFTYSSSKNF